MRLFQIKEVKRCACGRKLWSFSEEIYGACATCSYRRQAAEKAATEAAERQHESKRQSRRDELWNQLEKAGLAESEDAALAVELASCFWMTDKEDAADITDATAALADLERIPYSEISAGEGESA